jgi:adenine/guanine phosphoribosyltransferase-like PRPP-binding protein
MVNVRDAFRVKNVPQVRHGRIVLVDDVLTTGSTADACASALLAAGAEGVAVITLARAAEPKSPQRSEDIRYENDDSNGPDQRSLPRL